MSEVKSVTNNISAPLKYNINFRAAQAPVYQSEADAFIKEQEKARKNAKKQQNLNTGIQIAILAMLAGSLAFMAKQSGLFKKFNLEFKNLAKEKSLSEIALPQSQIEAADRIINRIEHHDEIMKKGAREGTAILFYGPPGTGKNTFAYAIAKKFSNAKFVEMDISKMNSKWHGESEQNVLGTMQAIIKDANKNPDQKYFVFIDEIDSVMMQDVGANAKLSQDILNAFKKGFNDLTNKENIIVMGATNLKINPELAKMEGKVLDSAMLDRFAQKVLVDLPTKSQIKESVSKFYQNPQRTMVDDTVKNINDPRWDKIAEFLSNKHHETSLRKLTNILGTAGEDAKIGQTVTFDDIIRAIQSHQQHLNATDAEIQTLVNSLIK